MRGSIRSRSCRRLVQFDPLSTESRQDGLGALHFIGRAVCGDQKAVGLDRRFIRDHTVFRNAAAKKRCAKRAQPAVATDSPLAGLVESLGKHFISAQVKLFPYLDKEKALDWLKATYCAGVPV